MTKGRRRIPLVISSCAAAKVPLRRQPRFPQPRTRRTALLKATRLRSVTLHLGSRAPRPVSNPDGPRQKKVEAHYAGTRNHQPKKGEKVQRFVELDEVVDTRYGGEFHGHNRHEHVDHQWNRHDPREKPRHNQRAADELRVRREHRVDVWKGDSPSREALRESIEIMDLSPPCLEEEISNE